MNTIKKTIFLSNKTENNNKTLLVLTLEKKSNGVFGTIKSYNSTPKGDLVLGIKCSNNIIKQNIKFNDNFYNFILNDKIDLNENIGCVVLSTSNNQVTPLVWGSEKNDNYKAQIINNLSNSFDRLQKSTSTKESSVSKNTGQTFSNSAPSQSKTKPYIKTNTDQYFEDWQAVDSYLSNADNDEALSPFRNIDRAKDQSPNNATAIDINEFKRFIPQDYLNFFLENNRNSQASNFSQISLEEEQLKVYKNEDIAVASAYSNLFETTEEELEKTIDNEIRKPKNQHNFFDMIAEQIDELFDKYPREKNLEALVENSRWCKINYDNNNKFYVVGIIYNDDDIKYVCYGVPGEYNHEPPRELIDYSQWLPVDVANPYSQGYWVMYQDADTGENVIVN